MPVVDVTADAIERKSGDEEVAAKRRAGLQRALKDTRERLTSSAGLNRAFETELATTFASARIGASGPLMLLALLPAAASASWGDPVLIGLWIGAIWLTTSIYHLLCHYFLKQAETMTNLSTWQVRFVIVEFSLALCWSGLTSVVGDPPSDSMALLLLFSLMLFCAVSSIMSATMRPVVLANLAGSLTGVAKIFYHEGLASNVVLMLMVTGIMVFAYVLSRRLFSSQLETLVYRAEKDDLIGELEQEKARSDEARKRAEDANLAKSRFLATMSHELRTPLNAILGFSEVMQGELFGPHSVPQYKEYSNDIHSSGEHLLSLINEVLDLSRIEAGRYSLTEEAVDLAGLVEDCRHMLDIRARKRELKVKDFYEPGLPRIWADERAIRQVVLNLLSNAIKFTPQGSEITIKVGWTSRGGQYVSIRDNGAGIPEEEIPLVLETFGRGSQAMKSAEPGSGLGLPIVKGLVELHGGTFVLRSKLREG
ncbi:MAG TPA: HAMP domain-containing sensor histidine kinase, partial [Beijerinckiaceae bacterium]|nr:HAMP domain-containing sensor histidine kinase [Beijerinckiaceae bacterium]